MNQFESCFRTLTTLNRGNDRITSYEYPVWQRFCSTTIRHFRPLPYYTWLDCVWVCELVGMFGGYI